MGLYALWMMIAWVGIFFDFLVLGMGWSLHIHILQALIFSWDFGWILLLGLDSD